MPAGKPPHKKDRDISPNKDRLTMLKFAVDNNQGFSLSDWEMKNDGYSYTAKTLAEYVPQINADQVFFIIGADSLAEIFGWKDSEYLLTKAKFIVFSRPGYNLNEIINDQKYEDYLENIFTYQSLNIEISSSFIRDEIKKGKSIRYLTLDKIREYIEKNNLYR
jgi:nicotinate-nucleotide adenylyltransferase